MKAWVKGGLWGAGVFFTWNLIGIIIRLSIYGYRPYELSNIEYILTFILSLIIYSVLGFLIGAVIGVLIKWIFTRIVLKLSMSIKDGLIGFVT